MLRATSKGKVTIMDKPNSEKNPADVMMHACVMDPKTDEKILNAIRKGIAESGAWMLNNSHVCAGNADYGIGVYVGKSLAYVMPINAHGTKIAPANLFGSFADASAFYVTVDAKEAQEDIKAHPYNNTKYSFITLANGTIICAKVDRHGNAIAKKYTIGKFVRMVATCIGYHVYTDMHLSKIDWNAPRGLKITVKPLPDLVIS